MKKFLLFLVVTMLATVSRAEVGDTFTVGELKYGVTSEKYLTVEVVQQDDYSSSSCTIPPSVEYGGSSYSVTSIGSYAFRNCTRLTSVTIPNSVTSIGMYAFWECSSLTSVEIPESVQSIDTGAFSGCSRLTSVTIPNSVSSIENELFSDCSSLTSVTIPNSVLSIGIYAFFGCSSLTSVEIPESLQNINNDAFVGCSSLTSLEIPESVEYIGSSAFENCSGLAWLIITGNQTDTFIIKTNAFKGCSSLFSVMFLPRKSEIADNAFDGCSFIHKVAAYDSSLFETGVFKNVAIQWTIEEDETVDAEKGIIWSADNTQCWLSGKYSGSLIMPDGMTQLDWWSFAECKDLTDVQLPATLEEIGSQSFMDTAVKEVVIPNRVTQVDENAFQDTELVKGAYPDAIASPFDESVVAIGYDAVDSKITDNFVYSRRGDKLHYAPFSITPEFEVPETVTEITDKAFYGCDALTRIVLPEKLSTLGESVWEDCLNITAVVCNNPEPVEAGRDVFHVNIYKDATLYVPAGCKSKYESVKPWSYFYNISDEGGAGIDSVTPDAADAIDFTLPVSVYSLQGVMVAESLDNLPAGIYIVRQDNKVKKVMVK